MKRELFEPTACQNVMFIQRKFSFYKQTANVATSVFIEEQFDIPLLTQAVKTAVERNDAFRVRFCKDGQQFKQYFVDKSEYLKFEVKDFRNSDISKMEKFFDKAARKPVPIFDTPMIRIYIVLSPDGKTGIFSAVSHMIMDSWAITTFYKDIVAVYDALKNGTEMPKPLGSTIENIKKELAYNASERHAKDQAFWAQELKKDQEPYFTCLRGKETLEGYRKKMKKPDSRKGLQAGLNTKSRLDHYYVSQATADTMNGFCRDHRFATAQVLFIAASIAYLAKVCETDDASVSITIARRGTLSEKNSGGTRIHFAFFRMFTDKNESFLDFCNRVYAQQMKYYKHMEINPFEIVGILSNMYQAKPTEAYSTHAITFQPVKLEMPGHKPCECTWHDCGATGNGSYLTVMDGGARGGFKCYYEYRVKLMKPEHIKRYHDCMMKMIEEGIKNPQITMGELMEKYL